MANRHLQAIELRFRRWRDRFAGEALFHWGLTSKAFFRYLGQRGDLIVRRMADHYVVLDPGDHTISYSLMYQDGWQRDQLERAVGFLRQNDIIHRGGIFVDVGANIGTQTIYAMKTDAFGGAISIEPEPRNFHILKLNILLNDLTPRVVSCQYAAGASDGELPFYIAHGNRAAHSLVRQDNAGEEIMVPVRCVDALVDTYCHAPETVAMVWIDIEGYEPQALGGMKRLLGESVPIVIETNPNLYERGMASLSALLVPCYTNFIDLGEVNSIEHGIDELDQIVGQHDLLVYSRKSPPAVASTSQTLG